MTTQSRSGEELSTHDERRHGEGAGVHVTLLPDTLHSIGLEKSVTWARFRLEAIIFTVYKT